MATQESLRGRTCTRQRAPAAHIMEHLWCSITFTNWVAAMAATTAAANAARRRQHTPPVAAMHILTVDGDEEDSHTVILVGDTHHHRAIFAPIRAIHHDGNDELIPDPSRPQADVDHRGHTRRDFLARHQQIQLHPAPIVAHFRSKPSSFNRRFSPKPSQQPISGHLVFSVHANEPPSASRPPAAGPQASTHLQRPIQDGPLSSIGSRIDAPALTQQTHLQQVHSRLHFRSPFNPASMAHRSSHDPAVRSSVHTLAKPVNPICSTPLQPHAASSDPTSQAAHDHHVG
ncbi:hypothetical protein ACLOJK_004986 [Asimina triloba]